MTFAKLNLINEEKFNECFTFARYLKNVNDAKLPVAWYIKHVFVPSYCKAIDSDCDTTAKFMLKYFDMRKQTVSSYEAVGDMIDRVETGHGDYTFHFHGAMNGFSFSVVKELVRLKKNPVMTSEFCRDKGITESWNTRDVRKIVDIELESNSDTSKENKLEGSILENKGGDVVSDENVANQSEVEIINALHTLVAVLGTENEALNAVALELVEKGYSIK